MEKLCSIYGRKLFTVEGVLPSLNEIVDGAKKHWSRYSNPKKKNNELVAWSCASVPRLDGRNSFLLRWFLPSKRKDPDNIMAGAKFIFDGMQAGGVIENDGWKQIGPCLLHEYDIDKTNPRVEVWLIHSCREASCPQHCGCFPS